MDLLLFGLQGGGKGTQARALCAQHGFHSFEAGGELRKIIASGSDLGKEISSYIDHGNLVPHAIIMRVMREAIHAVPENIPILFDGIPRDADQQRDFDAIMQQARRAFRGIELTIDEDAAIQRILQRGKEQGRTDDQDEASIRRRIELFHTKTQPVIEQYRELGMIETVDGIGTIDEVYGRILAAMERLGFTVR